ARRRLAAFFQSFSAVRPACSDWASSSVGRWCPERARRSATLATAAWRPPSGLVVSMMTPPKSRRRASGAGQGVVLLIVVPLSGTALVPPGATLGRLGFGLASGR